MSIIQFIDKLVDKLPWNRVCNSLMMDFADRTLFLDIQIPTENRTIYTNEPERNDVKQNRYCSNSVSTSKYTAYNFVPKNLLEQFMRIANLYFLVISCLQLFTGLSPTGRWGTALPLCIVVLFQMAKDGYEDTKRHIADRSLNNKKTYAIREGKLTEIKWHQVKVGDIVRVEQDEAFPADLVCLSSSEHGGLCFIETAQLDGETNLKIRRAQAETMNYTTDEHLATLKISINCEPPNNRLYTFIGNMREEGETTKSVSVDVDQILLRGAVLRNTAYIYGVAVYTGKQTKLMMNSRNPPFKRSRVEKITNMCIIALFTCQVVITLCCALGIGLWNRGKRSSFYIFSRYYLLPVQVSFRGLVTFFILFNNFIPISLYVSMELVKMFQARLFIDNDIDMYFEEDDIEPSAKTSSLNEELGQVKHIFSDKTGTLTQNKMEFLKFSVCGIDYGKGTTEIGRAAAMREGKEIFDDRPTDWKPVDGFQFYDERILNNNWKKLPDAAAIEEFFILLAVCHTVIPEHDKKDPSRIIFQAASPDEAALVKAAKHFGYLFHTRTPKSITITALGEERSFDILNVLEFNSTRKRMSVIVRDDQGKLILYTKGADNVIFQRLGKNNVYLEQTKENLREFGAAGLRTLVCAKAHLNEQDYQKWNLVFEAAVTSLDNKEEKVMQAAELIERNLEIVGTTAIEDKLQDGVPQTISELAKANIKIFVLTGDKQETAINIGYACALLNNQMARIILNKENRKDLKVEVRKQLELALSGQIDHQDNGIGLVIDGASLEYIIPSSAADNSEVLYSVDHPKEEPLSITFLKLCMLCKSVICCRVSPLQKSLVVKLVKDNHPTAVTLAIGDGANDVSMIQAAHLGIGIAGQEGLQAARASDYAIGQFRFLKKLLFVHGRWSYRRIGKLICYSFYKNITLQLTQFWYVFFNGFSGLSLYDSLSLTLFNVLFTSFPIIGFAVFDRDVSIDTCMKFPELYISGQKDYYFNLKVFLIWILNAVYHSAVCFFIPYGAYHYGLLNTGHTENKEIFGITIYTCVIIVVTLKVGIESYSWTAIHHLVIWGSILSWFVYQLLYSLVLDLLPRWNFWPITAAEDSAQEVYFGFYLAAQNPLFWFVLLLTCTVALLRDLVWECFTRNFFKTRQLFHALQEVNQKKFNHEDLHQVYDPSALKPPQVKVKIGTYLTCLDDKPTPLFEHTGYSFSQTEGGQADLISPKHSATANSPTSASRLFRYPSQRLNNTRVQDVSMSDDDDTEEIFLK